MVQRKNVKLEKGWNIRPWSQKVCHATVVNEHRKGYDKFNNKQNIDQSLSLFGDALSEVSRDRAC